MLDLYTVLAQELASDRPFEGPLDEHRLARKPLTYSPAENGPRVDAALGACLAGRYPRFSADPIDLVVTFCLKADMGASSNIHLFQRHVYDLSGVLCDVVQLGAPALSVGFALQDVAQGDIAAITEELSAPASLEVFRSIHISRLAVGRHKIEIPGASPSYGFTRQPAPHLAR